jgi:Fic family protein
MRSILTLNDFLSRLANYVALRSKGEIVDEKGRIAEPLHPKAGLILREAAIAGELQRSKIVEIVDMSERTMRYTLKPLLDEGLLVPATDWHRSPIKLGFPPHAAGHWFPNLFPLI